MFLQLVAGGHLLLFITRTERWFFLPPFPAAPLFWRSSSPRSLAVLMCGFGWLVPAIPWKLIGWVWAYNIAWMFVLGARRTRLPSASPLIVPRGTLKSVHVVNQPLQPNGMTAGIRGNREDAAWTIARNSSSSPVRRFAWRKSILPTPASTSSHEKALPEIQKHVERMDKLQYLLYADARAVAAGRAAGARRRRQGRRHAACVQRHEPAGDVGRSASSSRARRSSPTISSGAPTCARRARARW